VKWIRAKKQIPVDQLKSLQRDKKVYFADENRYHGPYVIIDAHTSPDSHGKKHKFSIELEGEILTDKEGKKIFEVKKARYLLEKIPQSLKLYYKDHYVQIIRKHLDSISVKA